MGYKVTLRRRAARGEDPAWLTTATVDAMASVGICDKTDGYYYESGNYGSGSADLSDICVSGVSAALSFSSRLAGDLLDSAAADDVLTIEVEPGSFDFASLSNWLRILSAPFGAYRGAVITDDDLDVDDYEKVMELSTQTGRDVDGRDSVYRFWPAMVIDEELAIRSFKIGLRDLRDKLIKRSSFSDIRDGRLWISFGTEFLTGDALDELHENLMRVVQ